MTCAKDEANKCPNCKEKQREIDAGLFSAEPLVICGCKKDQQQKQELQKTCPHCKQEMKSKISVGFGNSGQRWECPNPDCKANKKNGSWQ